MAITLKGLAQAIVINAGVIAAQNDPQLKLTPTGFLKALLKNNAMTQINNESALQSGQERDIKLRYLNRGLMSEVTDTDDCETPLSPDWKTATIGRPLFSKIGIFISDDEFRKYEEEAVQTLAVGTPSAVLMRGFYEVLLTKLVGLISKVDDNLVSAQASKWGGNAAYATTPGTNPTAAQSVAFGESAGMNNGIVKLQEDALINEINDKLIVVGNGLVVRNDIFNRYKTGADAKGFGSLPLDVEFDPRTISKWGQNHFGVFAKGTVGFVDFNRYVGPYAGEKGGSVFFTIPVPVDIDGELSSLKFDCQLKYVDCPVYDADGELVTPRGYMLIVSKSYGLFNLPNDAFATGDVLNGVNGSFHYNATVAQ